ncbi:CoA-transferase family III domain-containing protein [Zopfochytrium polystomum]|nr:CoA-transferase family III domain-containing protein [Zopfochytrium polystomum]
MSSSPSSPPPLVGLRVVEFGGLAPGPFAGMVLSDFGADVVRVDKIARSTSDVLARGKRSISVDLKSDAGKDVVWKLLVRADVVIDPFRPGVLERMGFGPDLILERNPKCIVVRLTGFGQTGLYSTMAGHDINYIATSGALSLLGRRGESPMFPTNLLGDFAGGSMMAVIGILLALVDRSKTGKGQVIDAAMVDGAAYLATFPLKMKEAGLWNMPRGMNPLDGGAPFYEIYKTKDGKYLSVGALEPQFYAQLIKGLGLNPKEIPSQTDMDRWPELKAIFTKTIASKTLEEWTAIFDGTDSCVTAVLDVETADQARHNRERDFYMATLNPEVRLPRPAPRLSRSGSVYSAKDAVAKIDPRVGEHTVEVLLESGLSQQDVDSLIAAKAVLAAKAKL